MNNDNKVETAIAGLNCWASYATVHSCLKLMAFLFYRDSESMLVAWCSCSLILNIKPIRLHQRHATLTDYRDKITMPRASDSYERNIMYQNDLYLRYKTRIFGPPVV